jgi:hypothetical protein
VDVQASEVVIERVTIPEKQAEFMTIMADSKQIIRIVAGIKKDYKTVKTRVEPRVVRWEWASDILHSYEPAYFEIEKYRPGKVITIGEDGLVAPYQYGYDAEGRVVVERQYCEIPGHVTETFFLHEPDGILELRYAPIPRKHWPTLTWFAVRGGRIVADYRIWKGQIGISQTYQYNDHCQVVRRDQRGIDGMGREIDNWHELEYNDNGKVERIHWCYPDGRRYLHYQRPTRKTSLNTRKQELLEGLTAAIIEGLRELAITDEVYVFVVRYWMGAEDNAMPPIIDLNTVPEAERLLKEHPDDLQYLWNPCEWLPKHCDVIYHPSPEIEALCAVINSDIVTDGRRNKVNRFLHELLHTLLNAKLPLHLAEDCVFIGLYVEHGEYELQVKEQLPEADRKLLMKKGWLPKNK